MYNYVIYNHFTGDVSVYTADNLEELWQQVLKTSDAEDYYNGYLKIVAVIVTVNDLDEEEF